MNDDFDSVIAKDKLKLFLDICSVRLTQASANIYDPSTWITCHDVYPRLTHKGSDYPGLSIEIVGTSGSIQNAVMSLPDGELLVELNADLGDDIEFPPIYLAEIGNILLGCSDLLE